MSTCSKCPQLLHNLKKKKMLVTFTGNKGNRREQDDEGEEERDREGEKEGRRQRRGRKKERNKEMELTVSDDGMRTTRDTTTVT